MKVTFIHPDFGIGGAERLVLDAAIALRNSGHKVRIVTNHFSPNHCFDELLSFFDDLTIVGSWFPRNIFGRFNALCAYMRLCMAAIYVCVSPMHRDSDVIFCDIISLPLVFLRLFSSSKLGFYCHYPDQLLTKRDSTLKILYRYLIDTLECKTIGMCDILFANSNFTKSVICQTFPSLNKEIFVLYPSLNTAYFDKLAAQSGSNLSIEHLFDISLEENDLLFLSVNRFEVKKNLELALHAFGTLRDISFENFARSKLLFAGGYDPLNKENINHHKYLAKLIEEMNLTGSVGFVLSPSDLMKVWLYRRSSLVVYTPSDEHFGIVPIEAMYLGRPVLAVNNGGPTETIINNETGFLLENTPDDFANVMLNVLLNPEQCRLMGDKARKHVIKHFSFEYFTKKLDSCIRSLNACG